MFFRRRRLLFVYFGNICLINRCIYVTYCNLFAIWIKLAFQTVLITLSDFVKTKPQLQFLSPCINTLNIFMMQCAREFFNNMHRIGKMACWLAQKTVKIVIKENSQNINDKEGKCTVKKDSVTSAKFAQSNTIGMEKGLCRKR